MSGRFTVKSCIFFLSFVLFLPIFGCFPGFALYGGYEIIHSYVFLWGVGLNLTLLSLLRACKLSLLSWKRHNDVVLLDIETAIWAFIGFFSAGFFFCPRFDSYSISWNYFFFFLVLFLKKKKKKSFWFI